MTRGGSILLHRRNLVAAAALVLLLVLRWKYSLPAWAFALFFVAPLVVVYALFPLVAARLFPAFERRVRTLQLKGDAAGALACWRRGFFLRAFGPVVKMAALRGQVMAALGRWGEARRAYAEALALSPGGSVVGLLAGHAEASFHAGEDEEALASLRRIAFKETHLPVAAYHLVHLLAGDDDEKLRRAGRKLYEGVPWDAAREGGVRRLALARLLVAEGEPGRAEETLGGIGEGDLPSSLRRLPDALRARIALLRGDRAGCAEAVKALAKDGGEGRHVVEAADLAARLAAPGKKG